MAITTLLLKNAIKKNEDKNLSFRFFSLNKQSISEYTQPHKKDHFCIVMILQGEADLHIEDKLHRLKPGKISIIFPGQVHFISYLSENVQGRIVLFEEILFCSDILKNELSAYNVNLAQNLNCTVVSGQELEHATALTNHIAGVYEHPSLVKKEQARFYIKILLLGLIESVHGQHPVLQHETDKPLYVRFKELLNTHYKSQRTVAYYANTLAITPKKLNALTKKHCGETAINAIHNRILTEIKRQLMFSELSHKEIAFDLGFSSPSALNKFVKAKLRETPTALREELAQIYTA